MSEQKIFYISGMTEDEKGGIFRCQWNGDAPQVLGFTPLKRNSFLTWGAARKVLYGSMQNGDIGGVAAYRVGADGELSLINQVDADGISVCYLEMSPDGRFLYSANYRSGNISEFQLAGDGSIVRLNRTLAHEGKGVAKEQEAPHPHCCTFTPDGRYLCVVDLGIDRIKLYPYDPAAGISDKAVSECVLPAGSGPRHLIFDAAGKIGYLLCELGNILCSLKYANGSLQLLQSVSVLPPGCADGSSAAVRVSKNGEWLYASTRRSNTIAVFAVDGSGNLHLRAHAASGGNSPRDFNFLSAADIAVAANEFSGEAVFFDCDQNSGKIGMQRGVLTLPRPLYVLC